MLHNRQGSGHLQVTSYLTLTGGIPPAVRERGDELQHLALALGKLVSAF
jgi:hypothetical protein